MKKYIIPCTQVIELEAKQIISTSDPFVNLGGDDVDGGDSNFELYSRGRRGFWNDEEFDY